MPVIPFEQRSLVARTPDVAGISPVAAGVAGGEVERAGRVLAATGNELARFAEAQRKAEQVLELSTAKVDLDTAIDDHVGGYDQDSDYRSYGAKFDTFSQSTYDAYREKVSPDVWRSFEPTLKNRLNQAKVLINHKARLGVIAEDQAQADTTAEMMKKRYAYTRDPLVKTDMEITTQAYVDSRLWTPQKREKYLATVDEDADDYASDIIGQKDPEALYKMLSDRHPETNEPTFFPGLTPEKRAMKMKRAEDATWTKEARREREERRLQDEVKYKMYDVLDGAVAGKMSQSAFNAEIDRLTKRDPQTGIRAMDWDVGRHMKNELKRELKEGGSAKTDNAVYWNLLKGIVKKDETTVTAGDVLAAEKKGKLSRGDTQELLKAIVTVGRTDQKKQTKEEKVFLDAKKQRTKQLLEHLVDTAIPNSGDTKELNGLLSRRVTEYADLVTSSGDLAKDLKKVDDYATDLVKWAKEGNKKKVTKMLFERALRPLAEFGWKDQEQPPAGPTVVETRRGADGAILEKLSDGTIRKR